MDIPPNFAIPQPTIQQGGSGPAWNPIYGNGNYTFGSTPGYDPYGYVNQQNQLGQQQLAYAQSPLYAQLMAASFGPQASMANTQYGADTNYAIAQGNANSDQTIQKMKNELGKYVADLENKSRVGVASIGADATKYGADRGMQGQLGAAQYGADASKYGSGLGYLANLYGSDRGLQGTMYSQDAGIMNNRYSNDANKAIAAIQADAAKYAPGLQQQRFNSLLPMLSQLFQNVMAKQKTGGTPYLGTMA